MSDLTESQALHLGMVNPPRKAKRLRELAFREPTGDLSVSHFTFRPSSPDVRPSSPPAAPRRRGRKPTGPMSRSAREQLRKTNHSVIEKRRREKINDALAALRELVPNDKHEGDKKKEEKEFKLEILVRTVEYLRLVVARVNKLEEGTCNKCQGSLAAATEPSTTLSDEPTSRGEKRKRLENEDEGMADDLNSDDTDEVGGQMPSEPVKPAQPSTSPSCELPRLPSISTWMSYSPPSKPSTNHHPFQLPSPPQSAPFAPINTSTLLPPGLTLPSPIGPGHASASFTGSELLVHLQSPASTNASPVFSFSPRDRDVPDLPLDYTPGSQRPRAPPIALSQGSVMSKQGQPAASTARGRASVSPVSLWTRDDQTAASLLLNISSRRSQTARGERESQDSVQGESGARWAMLEAQTPSSVLGMGDGR